VFEALILAFAAEAGRSASGLFCFREVVFVGWREAKRLLLAFGFEKEVRRVEAGLCPFCGERPGPFRDGPSAREFLISGLCQACQDRVFGLKGGEKS
jgi:hypothetical protein